MQCLKVCEDMLRKGKDMDVKVVKEALAELIGKEV